MMPYGFRDRDDVALSPLVAGVHKSLKRDTLPGNYLKSIGRWIHGRGYGFYEVDPTTGMPGSIHAIGVSHAFLDIYETVRDDDPLFQQIRTSNRPCLINLPEKSADVTSDFLTVFHDERLGSYMLGPVVVDRQLVATLNFARALNDPPFTRTDLRKLQVACLHVSRAYALCLDAEKTRREREYYRQALDEAPYALYLTRRSSDDSEQILFKNRLAVQADARDYVPVMVGKDARVNYQAREPGNETEVSVRSVKIDHDHEIWAHFLVEQVNARLSTEAQLFLTRREKELIECLIQGFDNKTISNILCISPHTVKQHFRNLFDKFSVHTRTELVARVLAASHLDSMGKQQDTPNG